MRVAHEEIFGPVVSVIPVRSLEEAIEVGNSVDYGLSASIYTQDVNKAFTAMRDMYTGIFYVNAPTIGAETHLPFGGHQEHGQRPPRGLRPGARRLLGVEEHLHRLQRRSSSGPRSTESPAVRAARAAPPLAGSPFLSIISVDKRCPRRPWTTAGERSCGP